MLKQMLGVAVLVAVAVSGVAASDQVQAVVSSYLEIQAALASDTTDGVEPLARKIIEAADKMGVDGQPIARAARAVAEAPDLKAAREAFKPLSTTVIAAVKAAPAAYGVKQAYCPMADASWLQKEATIRNPYYGSSMLTCGEFREIGK